MSYLQATQHWRKMRNDMKQRSLFKKILFWSSVVLLPGGSLLLLYELIFDDKFNKNFLNSIKKFRNKNGVTNEPSNKQE